MKSERLLLLVTLAIAITMCVAHAAEKPNVLFIAIDDLRTELGCYGEQSILSPNIDSLAASGVLFERAYCQVAVCNPSRVSIMTGLRPDTTKVWDLATEFRTTIPDAITIPKHFRNHGYRALSYGKIFHNPWPDNASWSEPHVWPKKTSLWSKESKQKLAKYRKELNAKGRPQKRIDRLRAEATEIVDIPEHVHVDGAIAEQALDAMRRLAKLDKPFFLATGFVRPHLPFVVPRKYWDLYDPATIPLATNPFLPKDSPDFAMNTMYELRDYFDFDHAPTPHQGSLTDEQQRRLKHGYYASVSFIDNLVGKLLAELESLGLAENTVVVLWSDHGWKLGEHNSWCKQTNYEIDTRVPLIIRSPPAKANGQSSPALVELVDVFPTLCELTGLPIPNQLEGKSMVPLLNNDKQSIKQAAFSQFQRKRDGVPLMGYSIRTNRYRYTEWKDRRNQKVIARELYDHETDPHENTNVAEASAQETIVAALSDRMWTTLPAPPKLEPQNRKTATATKTIDARPNIVFCMADDWSWPHASILGAPVVKTPSFDRVASEGVLFENVFVSTPSCTSSRLSILTGQHHWRLREGDSLGGSLREEYPVYTEMLQNAGYRIGRFGKGVWPSKHTFRNRDSFGEKYRSFDEFISKRKTGEPFCYWHGGQDPHRPYELGVGGKSGMKLSDIRVPACLPDNETVRSDVADYLWEVQRFDREVGEIIAKLETIGELDNTIIVVSGDNGMPFPRCKATLYDQGTRVPLAIRWGAKVKSDRRVSDFTSLCDLAPTFLDAAGVVSSEQMTGRSLLPILKSGNSGQIDPERNFAMTGMERHVYSYPARAIRTKDFLYIRNFNPEDWATGEIKGQQPEYDFATMPWPKETGAFSFNIDPGPTKQYLRLHREEANTRRYVDLSFGKHPEDELYDLSNDPDQLHNVANDQRYQKVQQRLRQQLVAELIKSNDPRFAVAGYRSQSIEGWPVRVSDRLLQSQRDQTRKAIELLTDQLKKVNDVVPTKVLKKLQRVPIWLSPEYNGIRPTAEYHPSGGWLQRVGRHPELAECVELTNINNFEKECQRMPMMILHELAHAYHHQVLGFDDARIKASYERAMASGSYEAVDRNNGKTERAYGMNNHKEYFAESTEAYFGINDFFPFDQVQLKKHDPKMFDLVQQVWEVVTFDAEADSSSLYPVQQPPASLGVPSFYTKYVNASGYPITASAKVNDYALKEAAYLIDMVLAQRPDIRRAMVASGSRMIVMGHNEFTTDMPEHSHLRPKDFWDARARGLGGSRDEPVCSCGEENLLGFEGDPYSTENILIHEFAHNIHLRGLVNLDPTFDDRLKQAYERAMAAGLWKDKYASTNHAEYFAEGVQSWFNNNRQPDHDHNHVDTRPELKEYDSGLAALCEEVFGDTELTYTKPASRLNGHLADYDPSQAARFEWPARLKKAMKEIHESVKKRSSNRQREYKN